MLFGYSNPNSNHPKWGQNFISWLDKLFFKRVIMSRGQRRIENAQKFSLIASKPFSFFCACLFSLLWKSKSCTIYSKLYLQSPCLFYHHTSFLLISRKVMWYSLWMLFVDWGKTFESILKTKRNIENKMFESYRLQKKYFYSTTKTGYRLQGIPL